jgi:hypothetical protein
MREKKFRKYAGIITILLFVAMFIPSALSLVEGTAGTESAGAGTPAAMSGSVDPAAGRSALTGIGLGTIAVGTAIAEAAVIAIAASQPYSSKSTTIH